MVDVLNGEVGLAFDCGPGMTPSDALKLAKSVEDMHITWLEDMITGDYTPYVLSPLSSSYSLHQYPYSHRRTNIPTAKLHRAYRT